MWRVNFRWESALYSALGGEEKPVVLMLQIYTMPKTYYTAPSAWPQRAPSATLDVFKTSQHWPRPIIVVNDPCLFLVIHQSLTCFLCAVHLAMGGPLLLLR